jgi:hypothetical protein
MTFAKPFKTVPLEKPNFLMRLFGRVPKHNALLELNNKLAAATAVTDVRPEDVEEIAQRYGADIQKHFAKGLGELYRSYLNYCLADGQLGDSEIGNLAHLKAIFGLSDKDTDGIREEVGERVFGREVRMAVKDGRLTEEEHAFLERLQAQLNLPDDIATRLYQHAAEARLQQHLDKAVADERLAPEEEEELHAIAKSLGVKLEADEKTQVVLSRYRAYWAIENAELPAVETTIHLHKTETCYAVREVKWLEYRKVTKRIRYAGPTARIRLAKGIYFRAGDLGFQSVSQEVLKPVDQGELYLTNKRVIFVGGHKSTNIRMSRILDFRPYSNGIELVKDSGRNPFFEFDHNVDLFALTLARCMKDSG